MVFNLNTGLFLASFSLKENLFFLFKLCISKVIVNCYAGWEPGR